VGLESALHTYVDDWTARYGVRAELNVNGVAADMAVPPDVGTAIYRIVQEALTNVAKHADATHVSVIVEKQTDGLRLIVEDNGRGFDIPTANERMRNGRRLGMASIRERAALVGGTLEVESSPQQGTAIYVRVPLATDTTDRS
jgi:two-component system, NarL family, sensor histidine kinase UhpB